MAAPPEDSGGAMGIYDKLDIMADRKHEYHEEITGNGWALNPEAFDIEKINKPLTKIK